MQATCHLNFSTVATLKKSQKETDAIIQVVYII